jgi:hypothetical protein
MNTPEERAAHYRDQAKQMRAMAEKTTIPEIKQQLLDLAAQYERLAESALRTRSE